MNPGTFDSEFKRFKDKFNIKDLNITALKLRHNFATSLIGSGENIRDVSAAMGHSNIQTTLQFYADSIQIKAQRNLSY